MFHLHKALVGPCALGPASLVSAIATLTSALPKPTRTGVPPSLEPSLISKSFLAATADSIVVKLTKAHSLSDRILALSTSPYVENN
jgi:hypothetical protein